MEEKSRIGDLEIDTVIGKNHKGALVTINDWKTNIDFPFATPYHSRERGANENTNGLIRQYIPKQTDLDTITEQYVQYVEDELNNRPRKKHAFLTPNEVLLKEINQTEQVAFTT